MQARHVGRLHFVDLHVRTLHFVSVVARTLLSANPMTELTDQYSACSQSGTGATASTRFSAVQYHSVRPGVLQYHYTGHKRRALRDPVQELCFGRSVNKVKNKGKAKNQEQGQGRGHFSRGVLRMYNKCSTARQTHSASRGAGPKLTHTTTQPTRRASTPAGRCARSPET